MTCTLPELEKMMKRARIETTQRPCPIHRLHIVKDGKVRDDLRIEPPTIIPNTTDHEIPLPPQE